MANPFEYFPSLASVLKQNPLWAVDSLVYQSGPAVFDDGLYMQVVNIAGDVVTKEYATDLLAKFKALGYKNADSITTKIGNVIRYAIIRSTPTDDRDTYRLVGPSSTAGYYEGDCAGYFDAQSAYNDVNGGGVGSPGAWTLPKGAPEPVWVPAPYTPGGKS